jgi:F0F1-type ATP synthase assembly protein I
VIIGLLILGFIFGIPRTLQEGDQINKKENRGADSSDEKQSQKISYQNNTNLEQISDWVTKILVGVGLTQIAQIPNLLDGFARYSHKSLGEFSNSGIYSQSLLIFSSIASMINWLRLIPLESEKDLYSSFFPLDALTLMSSKLL